MIEMEQPPEDLSGLPKHLWPPAQAHGVEMVKHLYTAGIAGHAAGSLGRGLRGQPPAMEALSVLVHQFNVLSAAYVQQMGWTDEQLGLAEAAIRAALDAKIIVPREPKIILDS